MPVCHRCERMQPSAELRRTALGHICKENGRGSHCWELAREIRAAKREAMSATRRAES